MLVHLVASDVLLNLLLHLCKLNPALVAYSVHHLRVVVVHLSDRLHLPHIASHLLREYVLGPLPIKVKTRTYLFSSTALTIVSFLVLKSNSIFCLSASFFCSSASLLL